MVNKIDAAEMFATLRARAGKIIKNGKYLYLGSLMNKAFYYMPNIWDELQKCSVNGRYIICSYYISYRNRNCKDA